MERAFGSPALVHYSRRYSRSNPRPVYPLSIACFHWRPWILDPAYPDDPTHGAWGIRQWRFDVALLDAVAGLAWTPPADGRTGADMRADLLAYADLPAIELKDIDSTIYIAKIVALSEQCIEPYTAPHQDGGWLASVSFAETVP